jgi:hypothetical protein
MHDPAIDFDAAAVNSGGDKSAALASLPHSSMTAPL